MTCIHGYDSHCGFCADRRQEALRRAVNALVNSKASAWNNIPDAVGGICDIAEQFLTWTLQPIEQP